MNSHIQLQNEALHIAIQERTCPPLDLIMEGGPNIEEHIRQCSSCRILAQQDRAEYGALRKFIASRPKKKPVLVKAGGVYSLLRQAAPSLCNEHGWHNPPLVLVIRDDIGIPGMVRVAQVFDHVPLSHIGDIPLRSLKLSSLLLAESWNTFAAAEEDLDGCLGFVSKGELDEVLEWSTKEMPALKEGSPVLRFRLLERNIAGFFGRFGAVKGLQKMEALETSKHAKIHDFRPHTGRLQSMMTDEELRAAFPDARGAFWAEAVPFRTNERRLAADTQSSAITPCDRADLDRYYGTPEIGSVNIAMLDIASTAYSNGSCEAEFRFSEGDMHILVPWKGNNVLGAVLMLNEDTEEIWLKPSLKGSSLRLTAELPEDISPDPLVLRVFVFAAKEDQH